MMNVLLKVSGTQKREAGEVRTYGLGQIDIDPKYVAEEFTLAELNMLRTHLATFDAVLVDAMHERRQTAARARLIENGVH